MFFVSSSPVSAFRKLLNRPSQARHDMGFVRADMKDDMPKTMLYYALMLEECRCQTVNKLFSTKKNLLYSVCLLIANGLTMCLAEWKENSMNRNTLIPL